MVIGEQTILSPGQGTDIAVTVTAEDGTQLTYTVTAVRAPAYEDTERYLGGERETEPAATEPKKPLKTAAPLEGTLVAEYAMECLSYNETTRDWRVHSGMDLAAEAGTEVKAAADGEVYTVFNDEKMGTTVVIRHQDGYTTHYASLAEEVAVKAGDQVQLGDVIGTVGSTALMESALGDHVCFRVTCNGEVMDPADFLNLN